MLCSLDNNRDLKIHIYSGLQFYVVSWLFAARSVDLDVRADGTSIS